MKTLKFALARVTLEATTPLTVGTGGGTDVWDSACVTDASGLPAIPGSSIAGALRQRYLTAHRAKETEQRFGYQLEDEGAPSSVIVSWASVHGENDLPVAPMLPRDDDARRTEFIAFLATSVARDHVRIGGHGAPDGTGKYDELLVPAGARFTFELRVDDDDGLRTLTELVGYLASVGFRLGGRSRRGFGAVKVVRWSARAFDLTDATNRALWARLPRDLSKPVPAGVLQDQAAPKRADAPGTVGGVVTLTPQDFWLFGGDVPTRPGHLRDGKPVGMLPKTERRITWKDGRGAVIAEAQAPNLVPASSVKGALRHRTLYHLLAAEKRWLDDGPMTPPESLAKLEALFGDARQANEEEHEALPGAVFFDDAYVLPRLDGDRDDARPRDATLDHVSLDRFTQGPMDGMLFREAPLHGGVLAIPVAAREDVPVALRRAFAAALRDLCEGRLALGGGSSRGHGYFRGRVTGSIEHWLGEG